MFNNKLLRIFVVVLLWLLYIFFPLFIFSAPSEFFSVNIFKRNTYLFISVLTIIFFYYNHFFSIPRFFSKQKYFQYFISLLFASVIIFLLVKFITPYLRTGQWIQYQKKAPFLGVVHFLRFLTIWGMALGLYYYKRYKSIESATIKSELLALKSQINPHFLFNTLNVIYSQAITKSDKTAQSVSQLSSMMRYVLTESNEEKVSIRKEIDYLKSYVDLQKQRLTDKTKVSFIVNGEEQLDLYLIPPLLLINSIENAFKYGVSTEINTAITIEISIKHAMLIMYVTNSKIGNQNASLSNNIGISNTKRRLDLLYGDNYQYDIEDNTDTFKVKLKVVLE